MGALDVLFDDLLPAPPTQPASEKALHFLDLLQLGAALAYPFEAGRLGVRDSLTTREPGTTYYRHVQWTVPANRLRQRSLEDTTTRSAVGAGYIWPQLLLQSTQLQRYEKEDWNVKRSKNRWELER